MDNTSIIVLIYYCVQAHKGISKREHVIQHFANEGLTVKRLTYPHDRYPDNIYIVYTLSWGLPSKK